MYEYEEVPFWEAYSPSFLEEGDKCYFAYDVLEKDINMPWVEGVSGDGIGEYIELSFSEEQTIDMLRIHP